MFAACSTPATPPPEASPAPSLDADVLLMLEVAAGSEPAFTALVHRHQQSLLNFFTRMGASSECEDLLQETFIRLHRYRAKYRPAPRFTTFLYHLARHVWIDHGRKIVRFDRLVAAFQNEVQVAGQTGSADRADVTAALARLSPKLREAIVLNIYQGLRYQEVADVLGIPLGTVKSRINLALAALKEILHER